MKCETRSVHTRSEWLLSMRRDRKGDRTEIQTKNHQMALAAKVLVSVGLFAVGVWILIAHSNLVIQHASAKGFEVWGLPAGFGFVIAGVAVLRFWPIKKSVTTTTTTTTKSGDESTTTTTTVTVERVEADEEAEDPGG
jgi:hypothetical protein